MAISDADIQNLIYNTHNAPVLYYTMYHSVQKCVHFCSECCIVGYGTRALWDLWIRSIKLVSASLSSQSNYSKMKYFFYEGECNNYQQIPSQRTSNTDLRCFLCCWPEQTLGIQSSCQWVEKPCMMVMRRHYKFTTYLAHNVENDEP